MNVDYVINATPAKRIINGYKKMKENFTEETAQDFYEIYSNESLSDILANSRMIFSEPYYGFSFYQKIIKDLSLCHFNTLTIECEKIHEYLEENEDKMSENQKDMYESLYSLVQQLCHSTSNIRIFSDYVKDEVSETFEEELSNALYEYKKSENKDLSKIEEIFDEIDDDITFMVYTPFVNLVIGNGNSICKSAISHLTESFVKNPDTEGDWERHVFKTIAGNKLKCDKPYVYAVNFIPKTDRIYFEIYMYRSLEKDLEKTRTKKVNIEDINHATSVSAVNSIFDDIYEASFMKEEYSSKKKNMESFENIILESEMEVLIREYQIGSSKNKETAGYSMVSDGITLENAYDKYYEKLSVRRPELFLESDEEDVTDDDINSLLDDKKDGKNTGKKPQAPKAKNFANKVQFKAMDAEAKQKKIKSVLAQKGQEVKNAVKAVAQLPKNTIDDIKKQVHQLDEADDERRKNYMSEPGFRKKAFRNLKLAILYGSAANVKLSLVPVVSIARHYSKQKDRRIQNELAREINTEIKICDEKIADANANNDMKEKYRLIRIKDQLDAELVRVKTNSKYV